RHTRFSRDWSSDVCSSDLAFDRCAGEDIPDDEIPQAVVNATYELALAELQAPGSSSPTVTPGRIVKRQKVEGIEREFFSAADGRSEERRVGKARGAWRYRH